MRYKYYLYERQGLKIGLVGTPEEWLRVKNGLDRTPFDTKLIGFKTALSKSLKEARRVFGADYVGGREATASVKADHTKAHPSGKGKRS